MSPILSGLLGFLSVLLLAAVVLRLLIWWGGRNIEHIAPDSLIHPLPDPITMTRQTGDDLLIAWSDEIKVEQVVVHTEGQKPLQIAYPKHSRVQVLRPPYPRPFATLTLKQTAEADQPRELVVAERFLPLKKVINMRDIGGYQTVHGRQIKWGKLFRGGDLSRLSPVDEAYLQALGLRLICDLRSQRELQERSDIIPAGMAYRHLPLNEEGGPFQRYMRSILFDRSQLLALMADVYVNMVRERSAQIGTWLTLVADPEQLPLLVHCTAGKDRTGLSIAVLMELLEVPRETIFADYTQSNRAFDRLFNAFRLNPPLFQSFGIPVADLRPLLLTHPTWLAAAFDYIDTTFGSTETYVREAAGLSPKTIDKIRTNLLAD